VVIQALTITEPKLCLAARPRSEGIDQSGFADPRLAAYKHHLTMSAQRPLEVVIEEFQLLPTLCKVDDSRLYWGKTEFEPGPGFAVLDLLDPGDKPVPLAWNGLDVFLPGSGLTESLAQSRDVVSKVALFYNSVLPNAADQLIFVDKVPVRFQEYTKGLEDLGAQSDRLSFPKQSALPRIEPKGPELVNDVRFSTRTHAASLRIIP